MTAGLPLTAQWTVETGDSDPANRWMRKERYASRTECLQGLTAIYSRILADGYLDATLDTLWTDSTVSISVVPGRQYRWQSEGLKPATNPSFSARYCASELQRLENNGFPFAQAGVERIQLRDSLFDVTFSIVPGPLVRWDSIVVKSASPLPARYLRNYITFKKGEPYSELWLSGLPKKLREIPFVRPLRAPEALFHASGATLYLWLEKKKANFFNGVLGVQPNENTGKINLTGDVELKLVNSLNSGEELHLNWRKLQSETQDLSLRASVPYLFALPIGTEGQLKIYRRDTSFTSVKSSLALIHLLGGQSHVRAFVEGNRTNRLSSLASTNALANVNATWYGLGLVIEKLDYRYNPRSGQLFRLEGAAGTKEVRPGVGTEAAQTTNMGTYRMEAAAEKYLPTWRLQTIRLALAGAGQWADSLYENEAYRLGGLRTMRGFDDESINATLWSVFTCEYRILPEENTCFYLFTDIGWYEYAGNDRFVTDTPIGYGAGVNFETAAGIFTFNYALGQQFSNPVQLRNAKVSFGFRSLF
ncbi:MAG: BamA/TamA family outer membrane protein [Flavobacteriales bacterium]|nr:BamA/TamA family outer membrane protein [Flavobacteriales bacterium]